MMPRLLGEKLNSDAMLRLQSSQYSESLHMQGTVPAGGTLLAKTAVSNYGDFYCLWMTGHFQTLADDGLGNTIDNAVCYLRGQLIDGNGQKKLFSDYIPFDLWLSPGRERTPTALNTIAPFGAIVVAPAPPVLFEPLEFEYVFSSNSDILLDVKNDGVKEMSFEIMLHGIRILSKAAVSGL
jgi:hypothetical protein